MHISGKIFAWLILPAAIAAVMLAARFVDIRTAWAEQVEQYEQRNEQSAALVAEKRKRVAELSSEYERLLAPWGNYWSDIDINVSAPTTGSLAAPTIGFNQGLGAPNPEADEKPVVYAFQLQPDGSSEYVGRFQASTLRENDSELMPTWNLLPMETDGWRSGKWRLREQIPRASMERFVDFHAEYILRAERLADVQDDLVKANESLAAAEALLADRRGELVGDPASSPPVEGLVAAIEREEAIRVQAEADVDRLRRAVQNARRSLVELAARNKQLAPDSPAEKPVASAGRPAAD